MKIRYAISSVPDRIDAAQKLCAEFRGRVDLFTDDPPSGCSWNNYKAALTRAGHYGEDWLVCLDDDAQPCINFDWHVATVLATCPGDFATFYLSHADTVDKARAQGASWIATTRIVHGIAWAIRPRAALNAVRVAERVIKDNHLSGDQRLLAWVIASGRHNLVAIPNIVNHRNDMSSVMKSNKGNARRRSAWYNPEPNGLVWDRHAIYADESTPIETAVRLEKRDAMKISAIDLILMRNGAGDMHASLAR